MNIYFGSTHLQTLCDLKALAEKHNCYIHFGVDQENSVDVDFNEFDGATKKIIEELQDKGEFLNQSYCKTSMFFELFDANNSTYNILTYSDGEQSVYYKRYYCEDLSAEAEAFLEDNLVEWQTMNGDELLIYCRLGGTKVTGFPNQEHPNVYREGMALKFFGDLVCDYLGEERIVRPY